MNVRSTAPAQGASQPGWTGTGRRVHSASEIHGRISDALIDEAALLDGRRFDEWADMLAHDLRYTAPIRLTRTGQHRNSDVMRAMMHFNEDRASILQRIGRFDKNCAWAEDPPSRTRRFVGNVRVFETALPDEYEVGSYLFLKRSRGDNPKSEEMTADRHDRWRFTAVGYQLVTREIIVDQSVLSMSNFAIFL